jgi:PAS domain S-box-containing protein
MKDEDKTKKQLLDELILVRGRMAELEKAESERKQTEEALQQSESKYRTLFDQATDGIMMMPIGETKFTVNESFAKLHGYGSPKEMEHLTLSDLDTPETARLAPERLRRLLTGESMNFEVEHYHKNGHKVLLNVSCNVVQIGGESYFLGFHQDITHRKRAEEALRTSEEKYRSIFDNAPIGIFRTTADGRQLDANLELSRILGYSSPQEMIATTNRTSVAEALYANPEERQKLVVNKALVGNGAWDKVGIHLRRKDGEKITVRLFLRRIPDGSTEPAILEGFAEDVSERRRAEDALRSSEIKYRIVADNTFDWEYWVSPEGRYLYSSPSCERITGRTAGEYEDDPELLSRIIHPDDKSQYEAHLEECQTRGSSCEFEFRIIHRDGTTRWIGHVSQPVFDAEGQYLGRRGSNREITDRKQDEEALQASEQRYRLLLSSVTDYIFTIELKDGLPVSTIHGPGCVAVTGFTPNDYARMPYLWYEMVHREDRLVVKQHAETALRGEAKVPLEHRIIHKNGTTRWVRNTMVPRYDTAGRIFACDGLIADITERKNIEQELKQTNTYLENVFENSPDAIGIVDASGRFISWNQMAAELYGYTFEEMKGKSSFDMYADKGELQRMLVQLRQEGSVKKWEMKMKRKDGDIVPFEISIGLLRGSQNKTLGSVAVARDLSGIKEALATIKVSNEQLSQEIAERRRAEGALLKSEKTLQQSEKNLRSLTSQLFTIQEKERNRISKELHDGLGQDLTVLKIYLNSIQNKLNEDERSLKDDCDFLLNRIDHSVADMRRLCHDLSPYLLEELGLAASLKHLFDEVCQRNSLCCLLDLQDISPYFPRRTLAAVYRVFQEALTNIVKHSGATLVSLSIKRHGEQVNFSVADNCKGFDILDVSQRRASERGMGLFAMEERTRMMGGAFQILSQAGRGTTISFSLSLKERKQP